MKTHYFTLAALMAALWLNPVQAQEQLQHNVYFPSDGHELSDGEMLKLSRWLQTLNPAFSHTITMSAHTDADGSDVYNDQLSQKRLSAVAPFVQAWSDGQPSIETEWLGERSPVAGNDHESQKAKNRRVEVRIDYHFQLPEGLQVPFSTFTIDPTRDTAIAVDDRGTVIHLDAYSVCDPNTGKKLQEPYELMYRNYASSSDMAFSGLPMTYVHEGERQRFNSAGMIEMRAEYGGRSLELCKPAAVDYALSKQVPDIDFYQLDDDSEEWEFVQGIAEGVKPEVRRSVELQSAGWFMKGGGGIKVVERFEVMDNGNRQNGTMLAEGADAGHTYPDVIKGLNTPDFGVYNCDQIYRLEAPVHITANYVDEYGQPIRGLQVLSLIDLDYNGAFSFDPENFICSPSHPNVLALFTQAGELYVLDAEVWQAMNITTDGNYTLPMKNRTDELATTEALSAYLGL